MKKEDINTVEEENKATTGESATENEVETQNVESAGAESAAADADSQGGNRGT